jgi:hypothetical protein
MTELLSSSYGTAAPSSMEDVVELSLLLPAALASELEAAAFQRGATTAEMVRRLVRDFLVAQKAGSSGAPWMFRKNGNH